LALKKQWQFPYFAKELFWRIGGGHCLTTLREWLESKQSSKIVAAAKLLESAGENFVFTQVDFVASALKSAYQSGEDCYQSMVAHLCSSATSGGKQGTPGQPMPRDVEIRDRATVLAGRFNTEPAVRRLYDTLKKQAEREMERDRHEYEEQFGDD